LEKIDINVSHPVHCRCASDVNSDTLVVDFDFVARNAPSGGGSGSGGSGGGSGGPCFIATAVYGDPSPEVSILRKYRDQHLLTTLFGRAFVSFYYFTSPPIARILQSQVWLNKIVRKFLNKVIKMI